jgi:hypothetical protein
MRTCASLVQLQRELMFDEELRPATKPDVGSVNHKGIACTSAPVASPISSVLTRACYTRTLTIFCHSRQNISQYEYNREAGSRDHGGIGRDHGLRDHGNIGPEYHGIMGSAAKFPCFYKGTGITNNEYYNDEYLQ